MVYSNKRRLSCKKIYGQNGVYIVGKFIGKGGNGEVYTVRTENREIQYLKDTSLVVKFLTVQSYSKKESQKRRIRFENEIRHVTELQDKIDGIMPIYDTSIDKDQGNKALLWYIMPKAEVYKPQQYSIKQKLEHMQTLGNCLNKLHKFGYAHRDIKPKNLLMWNNQVYLSDFGLIWNVEDTDQNITEINDCLGPLTIRPPELQMVENIHGVDYRKSDVYLFAKTIWMIIRCDKFGFYGKYSRMDDSIYIDQEKYNIVTAEPLHRLMEEATKLDHTDRIEISKCLEYIKNQLKVVNDEIPESTLSEWKYIEKTKRINSLYYTDERVYKDKAIISDILNSISGLGVLIFSEHGKELGRYGFTRAGLYNDDIFEVEILNPYDNYRHKSIALSIASINLKSDMSYDIHTNRLYTDNSPFPSFNDIILALMDSNKRVRLDAEYIIRIENPVLASKGYET